MSAQFHIRPAQPKDAPILLEMIVELADYEHARDSVKATPEILRKNLFETPYAHALIAFSGPAGVTGGEALGFALYFFNFSTWTGKPGLYLEDLYVKPEHRSKGLGKAFFVELGKAAQAKASNADPQSAVGDCARLDWSVLKWNKPSIDFYEKSLNATMMSEWVGMRLEEDGIENLKRFSSVT